MQIVLLLLKQNDYIGLPKTSQAKQKIKAAAAAGFSVCACFQGKKGFIILRYYETIALCNVGSERVFDEKAYAD